MKRSAAIALTLLSIMSTAIAAPHDIMQRQILQQKEQEQTSKRAEKDVQHRVSQSMAKTQQQGSRLEVFCLTEKTNSFN